MTQIETADDADKVLLNRLTERIIGLCFEIHNKLGPGFVEKIYEKALCYELQKAKIPYNTQEIIKVRYKDVELGEQRIDFIIDNSIILELKCVPEISNIHKAQIISYLKTLDKKIGLILNFAKDRLEIKRVVNKF